MIDNEYTDNGHTKNSYKVRRDIERCNENSTINNTLENFSKLCTNIKELTPKDFMEGSIQLINSLPSMNRIIALKIVTELHLLSEYLPEYEILYILNLGLDGDKYGKVKYRLTDYLIYPIKQTIKMFVEYNKLQEQDK